MEEIIPDWCRRTSRRRKLKPKIIDVSYEDKQTMSKVHIYSGGTFSPIRNHLGLDAKAFGNTGRKLQQMIPFSQLHLTKMADNKSELETNDDVQNHLESILKDPFVKCIVMNAALCDYTGQIDDVKSGPHAQRLNSRDGEINIKLTPAPKIIPIIKEKRPDIMVVGFKTVTGDDIDTMIMKAERMNVDIVFINDTLSRVNYIYQDGKITGRYPEDRKEMLEQLAKQINQYMFDINKECPILDMKVNGNSTTFKIKVAGRSGGYITKNKAFENSVNILKNNGYDYKYYHKAGWDHNEQGVYTVSATNNDFNDKLSKRV